MIIIQERDAETWTKAVMVDISKIKEIECTQLGCWQDYCEAYVQLFLIGER